MTIHDVTGVTIYNNAVHVVIDHALGVVTQRCQSRVCILLGM